MISELDPGLEVLAGKHRSDFFITCPADLILEFSLLYFVHADEASRAD